MTIKPSDSIVISGISGRLPECNNIDEFKQNLLDGIDMVTTDDRRWPAGIKGTPKRSGKLKDINHFDAAFFGVLAKQAHTMDPQLRMLLEVTYETIIDAGVNPLELKGSRTGVYVGSCLTESLQFWTNDVEQEANNSITGCSRNMFANRISFNFDFTGPSFCIDSACSSSMLAFQQAVDAIKSGQCDSAIVAGVNLLLNPSMTIQFNKLRMLSLDGKCKSFDASGDGYVRSETVIALLLQKATKAKRLYATVLGAKSNTDGYKEQGITFPSREMQNQLITEVYSESGIDPNDVVYLETHGTGTKVGDPQELNSAVDAFCKSDRKTPLLIGAVKSNMGHSEPASGLCSIAKVVIAMERGIIPANLHFQQPNSHIPGLTDGRIKVVSKNENWTGGLVGVNCFGFGGANVHIILSSNTKEKLKTTTASIPRLLMVSGRTCDAVNYFLDKIIENPYDEEFYALIDEIHKHNIVGHNHRGYCLLGKQIAKEVKQETNEKPPVWFIFTGMGCQWPGMGKDLMIFEPFRKSIERSADTLKLHGIDLLDIIVNGGSNNLDNLRNAFVSVTAIQIALVDLLKFINIAPDGLIGHSIGEIGCAYADGTVTSEQAILLSYARGTSVLESGLPAGAMASIGLTWKDFKNRAPSDIYVACHNSKNNLTISGPPAAMKRFIDELNDDGIFTKEVNIYGLAFHSKYIAQAGSKLRDLTNGLITNPKPRSSKWISSSIPESDWDKPWAKLISADYFINNFLSPVYFYEATKHVPDNAIVLEIAPHHLLQAILKRSLSKNIINIGLLRREHSDNAEYLLSNIGRLYNSGGEPNISVLYPTMSFPVSRGTPMLASMIKWDHSMEWTVANFASNSSRTRKWIVEIDLCKEEFKYLHGHVIDGRIIFPETGYMTMVWETFAKIKNKDFNQLPIILENVRFLRPTILHKAGITTFIINIFEVTGKFEIYESGSVVASGRIYAPTDIDKEFLVFSDEKISGEQDVLPLNMTDIYKELHFRGYNYDGTFKGITNFSNLDTTGNIIWKNNWVTFIDAMLQVSILEKTTRKLYLPSSIQKILINPKNHMHLNSEHIPVYIDNRNIIRSGGVEMWGLENNSALIRQNIQVAPKIETYQFIPLENNILLAEDTENSVMNALTVASQLVFRNSAGALKLKVIEVVTEKYPGTYVLLKVKQIMDNEPMLYTDCKIITSLPIEATDLEAKSIEVYQKDVVNSQLEQNIHLIILRHALLNQNSELISNAVASLKTGGFILFQEPHTQQDSSLIKSHSLITVYKQVTENDTYILARKSVEIPTNATVIKITEKNYEWVELLRNTMIANESKESKFYLLCQGEELNGIIGLINCIMQEPGGLNVRCIFIQDKNEVPFSISCTYYRNQLQKDLVLNVLKNGIWGTFGHLILDELTVNTKRPVEYAFVNPTTTGDLSSLQWTESQLKFSTESCEDSELCTVYYSALNCHDLKIATGKLSQEPINDSKLHGHEYSLGLEFAGRNSKGKRVMGMVTRGSLASAVLCKANFLWEIPDSWNLEDAATIPVAYSTSYYALIIRGQLQPGETILIHSGSKSIGQASISIALHMGCYVFTTVDNTAEREFLKRKFPELMDDCIGNASHTSFEQMIRNKTDGRGVDLVINTLSGDELQASMRCLAYSGRFLEMNNIDPDNDYTMDMSVLLKNITFHGISLDSLLCVDHKDNKELKRLITEGISNGAIVPFPKRIFQENEMVDAFKYMSSKEYIRKVLIKIRDEEKCKIVDQPKKYFSAISKEYMNPEKVYILIGGLGGFGLELANWLIMRGAKNIVFSSRNGIKSGYQSLCIRRWKNQKVKTHIVTYDVTTEEGAKKLLIESISFGKIGGIFNLALVLKDDLMCNQVKENFKQVCAPKADATKHLDNLSRILAPHLDYFVVFSSVSCGRGNPGQANYGYANSVMERICENRQAAGFPALAIQWGPIDDTGILFDTMTRIKDLKGTLKQRISSCLSSLDMLLRQPYPVVSDYILGNKETNSTDVQQIKLTDAVANILGLSNHNSISKGSTLAHLGMDSLMCSEIKTTLDRDYDLMLNVKEIRALTFAHLFELESTINCTRPLGYNKK